MSVPAGSIRCLQYPFVAEAGCWVHGGLPSARAILASAAWSYPLENRQRNLQTATTLCEEPNEPGSTILRPAMNM